MGSRVQAVSLVTLLLVSLHSSASDRAGAQSQQESMSKWVRAWLANPPKTREVSEALDRDLIRNPMHEAATKITTPVSRAKPADAKSVKGKPAAKLSIQQPQPKVTTPEVSAPEEQEKELEAASPSHEVFSGKRSKPAKSPKKVDR